jgi:hypothetical protein
MRTAKKKRSNEQATSETPKVGETWHILRAGATACVTLKIAEMKARTVLFEPVKHGIEGERIPLGMGLRFIERVSESCSRQSNQQPE